MAEVEEAIETGATRHSRAETGPGARLFGPIERPRSPRMAIEILCDDCGEPAGPEPLLGFLIDPDGLQVVCLACLPSDDRAAHDEELRELLPMDLDDEP
jgi:hypothetical protein